MKPHYIIHFKCSSCSTRRKGIIYGYTCYILNGSQTGGYYGVGTAVEGRFESSIPHSVTCIQGNWLKICIYVKTEIINPSLNYFALILVRCLLQYKDQPVGSKISKASHLLYPFPDNIFNSYGVFGRVARELCKSR